MRSIRLPFILPRACGLAVMLALGACSSSSNNSTDRGDGGTKPDGAGGVDASDGAAGGGGAPDGSAGSQTTFQGDRRVPLIPADDVQFIDFFVPHHQAAIDMATMELDRGADSAVKAMAMRMKTSQMEEITKMRQARQALTGTADSPAPPADPHMMREMQRMMSLSGGQLDKVFLEEMIPHHAAALPVAHRGQTVVTRDDLKMLAVSIYDAQAKEIGDMKMMLGEPTGGAQPVAVDGGTGDASADGGVTPPSDDTAVIGDRRVPYTPADDTAFIDFFVPHHQNAIEMAMMVIDRGARGEVKALAQRIKDAQTAEIAKMKAARQQLAGSPDSPAPPPDPHMMADLAKMMTLSGAELDSMFLREMIPHHAAGLPPSHRSLPRLQRADMRQLALDIFSAQSKEIGEMHELLEAGPASDGGTGDDIRSDGGDAAVGQ